MEEYIRDKINIMNIIKKSTDTCLLLRFGPDCNNLEYGESEKF